MSTAGRRWSSHLGSHQGGPATTASTAGTAGTNVVRTTNPSTSTPTARANAIGLMTASSVATKLANTENMITAAAVTTRDTAPAPARIAGRASPVRAHSTKLMNSS